MEDIRDLKFDDHNANRGTEDGMRLLEKSVGELGAGRSVLVDKNDNVIAGNKTLEAAIKSGIKKIIVVETEGDKLVAVKRTDLDINSRDGRAMAIADNAVSVKNTNWDEDAISHIAKEFGAESARWGGPMVHIADDTKYGETSQDATGQPVAGANNDGVSTVHPDDENGQETQEKAEGVYGSGYDTEEETAGQQVICPNCFNEFTVECNG